METSRFNPAIGFYYNEAAEEKTFVTEGTRIRQFTQFSYGDEAYMEVDEITEKYVTVTSTTFRAGRVKSEQYICPVASFREMVDGQFMEVAYQKLADARNKYGIVGQGGSGDLKRIS